MHDGFHFHPHSHPPAQGHNHTRKAGQWQMPHLRDGAPQPVPDRERDLDLVEISFIDGFQAAKDPTSFLRMANIPFVGLTADGQRLHLLRVETAVNADVGSVTPSFGGGAVLYDPLPAQLVQHRKALSFLYHDGQSVLSLSFAEARQLFDDSGPSKIEMVAEGSPEISGMR